MKVVKKTGLVPVYSLRTGDIFGVSPDKAREMVNAKLATFADVPEGVETYEVADAKKPAAKVETKEAEVSEVSHAFQEIAGDLGITIIVLSQLNADGDTIRLRQRLPPAATSRDCRLHQLLAAPGISLPAR